MSPLNRPMWTRAFIVAVLLVGPVSAESAPPSRLHIAAGTCEQLPLAPPPRTDEPLPSQAEARPTAVDSVRRILDQTTADKVARVKEVVAKQRPVLFVPEHPGAGKLVGDLWTAADGAQASAGDAPPSRCGNAMVIVAYDDARYGGAFEVLQDCGATTYAETAFWLRYGDFNTICQCAVELGAGGAAAAPPPAAPTAE
jgi:hypothetical protein